MPRAGQMVREDRERTAPRHTTCCHLGDVIRVLRTTLTTARKLVVYRVYNTCYRRPHESAKRSMILLRCRWS